MTDPRPLGPVLENWSPPPAPSGEVLEGAYARLEPLSAEKHAALLFRAYESHDAVWDYMPYGPFHSAAAYHRWVKSVAGQGDPFFYAIQDKATGAWGGVASYLRIRPDAGSIEIGHINLSPHLQGTRASTEAFVLMMKWAFQAGYRRFEWKCDALNKPSRRAAQRLGLSFEGVFRQHVVVKGRNRDTAWFAAIDKDWPSLSAAYDVWLSANNFTADGQQSERLGDLTQLARTSDDPALS
ncbi:Protein N-acetyltransferase, RimJ/RimL family [Shimia gijangensis]|uniref:Protein N-acetyltransferase, RimJ/RimL family n=1 Tax=Shimia gijangensis TaxID=1470563 RepID=A0A1M6Q7F2_9RHOB|nr:GNAT family protein [Shimia gijangensis]SHK16182.1 Protein N-acetyltransferase, RimJ/RimL family [Shimia gijangensis]